MLLTNSCARRKATPDSCLDILVLLQEPAEKAALEQVWEQHHRIEPIFRALEQAGKFSLVHLDIGDGR